MTAEGQEDFCAKDDRPGLHGEAEDAAIPRAGAEAPDTLRLAGVVRESIVDGPGLRFVIFCQGCPHDCPGCHNPDTHDFHGGYDCAFEKILGAIEEDPLLDGVTFSGGEPFSQAAACSALGHAIRRRFPKLTIFTYSGYTFEQLLGMAAEDPAVDDLLRLTDMLVDGPYVAARRDLTLLFRGSGNQRILDVPASLAAGEAVLCGRFYD